VAYLIGDYLSRQGHVVLKLACFPPEQLRDEQHTLYLPDAIEDATPNNVNYLKNLVAKEKVDIVINESSNSDAIFLFSHQHLPSEVKIISHLHFDIFGDIRSFYRSLNLPMTGISAILTLKNAMKWLKAPFNKRRALMWKRKRYRYMLDNSDRVVLLTHRHVDDYVKLTGPIGTEKLIAVTNPMSFTKRAENIYEKENIVLFVGRLDFNKRIDRILRVWYMIESSNPEWRLLIIGDGPDAPRLKEMAKKNKLKHVSFAGQRDPEQFYQKGKMLVMSSNYEGTPMVIPEAMSYGVVPVIMDTFPGSREMISDGIDGILTKAFNLKDMARAVHWLMNDRIAWSRMSCNAHNRIAITDNETILSKWDILINR